MRMRVDFSLILVFRADMGALKTSMQFLLFFLSSRKLKMFERLSKEIAEIKSASTSGAGPAATSD